MSMWKWKNYVDCCKKKRFTFKRDKDYGFIKEIPINKELMEVFEIINSDFEDYYGRKMYGDDLVSTGFPNYRNIFTNNFMSAARKLELKKLRYMVFIKQD